MRSLARTQIKPLAVSASSNRQGKARGNALTLFEIALRFEIFFFSSCQYYLLAPREAPPSCCWVRLVESWSDESVYWNLGSVSRQFREPVATITAPRLRCKLQLLYIDASECSQTVKGHIAKLLWCSKSLCFIRWVRCLAFVNLYTFLLFSTFLCFPHFLNRKSYTKKPDNVLYHTVDRTQSIRELQLSEL